MQSLTYMLVNCRLEQRHVTCEQSWRLFVSSHERKKAASLPVLLQGKRKNHRKPIPFLAKLLQSHERISYLRVSISLFLGDRMFEFGLVNLLDSMKIPAVHKGAEPMSSLYYWTRNFLPVYFLSP